MPCPYGLRACAPWSFDAPPGPIIRAMPALPPPAAQPLHALLADAEIPVRAADGDLAVPIWRIAHDSRATGPGTLFTAYQGVNQDVHGFLPDAFRRGAAAALVERAPDQLRAALDLPPGAALVQVDDAREARARIAAALYGHPSRALAVVGVTGTDGKTTTSTLVHAILGASGMRAGLISTVAAQIGDASLDTGLHVTTPEPEDVQAYLAAMRDAGARAAVLEVTSHGLSQHRVTGVAFDVAVLTNVTREALEYHGTFAAYRDAKVGLFRAEAAGAPKPGVPRAAVINADDPSCAAFRAAAASPVLTYTASGAPADFRALAIEHSPAGLVLTAATPRGDVVVRSPLVGAYNAANLLAAMAACHALGVGPKAWQAGAAAVAGIPGRMERIDEGQPFAAIVDFAHTPNALAKALATGRDLAGPSGRVIAVFGCAGLRDAGKRALMGEVAGRLADVTVITAEDPRTEDVGAILEAIGDGLAAAGASERAAANGAAGAGSGRAFVREPNRGAAIALGVAAAGPGDVLLVCGKGHEQSMCVGQVEHPWDDRDALRAALRGEPQPRDLPI